MSYIFQTYRVQLDEAVKKHASLLHGNILDVGAGSFDRYSHYFSGSEYVRMNVQKAEGTDLVGHAEKIPSENNTFDGIVCTQVLGDILDPSLAFEEFRRVLKPGGRVLLTESFMDPLHDEPHDYWRFTPYSLNQLLEEQGFKILVTERIGGYYSTLAQFKARYAIERFNLYHAWYRAFVSRYLKWKGSRAMKKDYRDTSKANERFAQGWLVVAEKQ